MNGIKIQGFPFLMATLLVVGCQQKNAEVSDAEAQPQGEAEAHDIAASAYIPTKIPEDVSKLYVEVTEGNDYDTESVLLINQGGPLPLLLSDDVASDIADYQKKYRTYLLHQAQTYNTLNFANAMDFDQITQESRITIDMLHKVVQHFKGQGKKVYLWGSSFGFFVVENYIANYGTDDIAGAFAGNGRLDMNEVVWKGFSTGDTYMFDEQAITPIADADADFPEEEEPPEEEEGIDFEDDFDVFGGLDIPAEQMDNFDKNITAMAAGLGQYRHTELLADKDLSKVVFFYGEFDRVVGTLTADEIAFLTETLAPEKRPEVIKGVGLGHGQRPEGPDESGKDYTLEIMQKLFSR